MKQFHIQGHAALESHMVVPWFSEEEFRLVCSCVASEDTSKWRVALDHLMIWKARDGRRFQDILDITLSVLNDLVTLDDANKLTNGRVMPAHHNAALTVVRFVSLMTEGSLTDKVERPSVLTLARKLGIPDWMVDMRHNIVHTNLPTLAYVRKALIFIKHYAYEQFWSLESNIVHTLSGPDRRNNIRTTLRSAKSATTLEHSSSISQLLSVSNCVYWSMILDETAMYMLELSQGYGVKGQRLNVPCDILSQSIVPVLDGLRKAGLLDNLLDRLIRYIVEIVDTGSRPHCAVWIFYLITDYFSSTDDRERLSGPLMRTFLLCSDLVSYTDRLVSLLKVEADDIVALSRVLDSETVQPSHKLPDHYKIYTPDDLPITVRRNFGKDRDDEMSDTESDHVECNWTLASDIDWSNIALGQLPVIGEDASQVNHMETNHECDMSASDQYATTECHVVNQWSDMEMKRLKANIRPIK